MVPIIRERRLECTFFFFCYMLTTIGIASVTTLWFIIFVMGWMGHISDNEE
ncbi:hypothetical protein P168DRAFT_13052 [Aspergillus campestris IBT 28561]|uniref:Uncharacterized protein n=1 Tax=Aspergillus campestris (strain IBT 28561) TaxID=1392248 RepID=A0A2I1DEH1_ASPC2|nr:uncharacterized protein P168DRAFT_13052 [Aspergillus campestris IBT 28561]PKY08287.1 hypothetical protein P168DRAFT_13052 [Aspergillus campestris IBT 28561]